MGIFKVSTAEDKIKDSTGGNYINKSGIYDVIIKHAIYSTSPNGSTSIDLNFDYNGQNQTIFSAIRLTNNDGKENFESANFNKLCIIAGKTDGAEIADPVPVELPLGKNQEIKEVMELEDFRDLPVAMRVQMEYHRYQDKIQESKRVRNFFRNTDHATASEIVNGKRIGNQYEEELKIADKSNFKDDITPEEVIEFKKNRNTGGTGEDTATPTFKRRSFGKQEQPINRTPF